LAEGVVGVDFLAFLGVGSGEDSSSESWVIAGLEGVFLLVTVFGGEDLRAGLVEGFDGVG